MLNVVLIAVTAEKGNKRKEIRKKKIQENNNLNTHNTKTSEMAQDTKQKEEIETMRDMKTRQEKTKAQMGLKIKNGGETVCRKF